MNARAHDLPLGQICVQQLSSEVLTLAWAPTEPPDTRVSKRARPVTGRVLQGRASLPGHPDTLDTRHEVARMMAAQGDLAAALAEFQDLQTAKIRILGTEHPSTALTAREIDSLQSSIGKVST